MSSVALEPACRFTHAELAEIFTAGYEGYLMPVSVDEAAFGFMAETCDYDLDASVVATDGGENVGFCMLAVRGEDGWIGGVGVVTSRRGEGIGERLVRAAAESARSRGVERLWLEVLVQNEPAIRLYEKLGYEHVRELEVWSLENLVLQEHKVSTVAVADVLGRARERLPWQRADATVAKLADAQALSSERGSLIYRMAGSAAVLLQVAADDPDAVRELLRSLPEGTTALRYVNGPTGDPANAALQSLGATQTARQHEMVLGTSAGVARAWGDSGALLG